jgi:hypothetical protein
MLSFGSAAFTAEGTLLSTYTANLELLPGAQEDPSTKEFWRDNREAYAATRVDLRPAEIVMPEYARWLKGLPGKPIFVGYPAGFDFSFIYMYLHMFAGESPFGFAALDIKTYAMAVLGISFAATTKRDMPRSWRSSDPHTHVALDDAIEQGRLFCNMLNFRKGSAEPPGVEPGEVYLPTKDGAIAVFSSSAERAEGVKYVRFLDKRGVELQCLHISDTGTWGEDDFGALLGFLRRGYLEE